MDEDNQKTNNQPPANNIDQLQKDLEDAITQAQTNLDGWKRTAADFENYRRRKETENQELVSFAREVAVAKLLPTLDSLEQALRHMPEYQQSADSNQQTEFADKYQSWQKGVNGLVVQLDKALAELGVKKIEAIGKKFDPNFHEAVREVEGEEDGMVTDELQTGFELNGKVIRPSQVVISKKNSDPNTTN